MVEGVDPPLRHCPLPFRVFALTDLMTTAVEVTTPNRVKIVPR